MNLTSAHSRASVIRVRRIALSISLFGFVVFACSRPAAAQGVRVDSLLTLLAAPDWPTREEALSVVRHMPVPMPPSLASSIVALVKREALTPTFGAGSEDFGEYLIDLAVAATKTGDKSTIPALIALGGVGISSGVAAFVASAGPAILPSLDSIQRGSPSEAGALLETVALMYAQQGALLSPSDSAALLGRLLGAAGSPVVSARQTLPYLALRIPLPDFLPLLRTLAQSDTFQFLPEGVFPVRLSAQAAVDTLGPAWSALPAPTLLAALEREQMAACVRATGALFGHCQAMGAQLATAASHLSDSNSQPARSALDSFRNSLQQAARAGLATWIVQLMDANAAQVLALLGP